MVRDAEDIRVERSAKRVRATIGRELVVDTERALLVWEKPAYPAYYMPREDLRANLVPADAEDAVGFGSGRTCDLYVGDRRVSAAAVMYEQPAIGALADHVRIAWDAVDAWFEEDEEIFVHPRDPYTRLDILPSSRHVVVQHQGMAVADSVRPVRLFETGLMPRTYLRAIDVHVSLLAPSSTVTRCPYKGQASYFHLRADGLEVADIAWRYLHTTVEANRIAGLYCFHDEKVELLVDGHQRERAPHPSQVR